MGNLSLSALLARLKHFSCHGALVCRASGSRCGDVFKNNDSVIVTQRIFLRHFNIHWKDSVLSHNTELLWVRKFGETSSAAKKKNLQEESIHLELLTTSNKCVRLLSEVLSDQQAEMPLH